MDVADSAVLTGIAPRPAEAVIEHVEPLAGRKLADRLRLRRGAASKRAREGNLALDRLGVMGSDHPAGESDIGEILAIGVELRIGLFRRSGEREFVSADARRPGPDR